MNGSKGYYTCQRLEFNRSKLIRLLKITFRFNAITLDKKPNDRYKGHGANTLFDQKRGTINFVDGNRISYENGHFKATIQANTEELVSSVSVGHYHLLKNGFFIRLDLIFGY